MANGHTDYEALARDCRGSEEYRQGYAEARRAFLIGQAVRNAAWPWACPRPSWRPVLA